MKLVENVSLSNHTTFRMGGVAAYVAEAGKKLGISDLKVSSFIRLELGQGVEKKAEDFAAEVAATVAAATKG